MTFLFVLYHWRQWMIKFTVTLHNVAGRKKFQQVKSTVYIVCVLCCYVWKCFYNVWTLVIDMHLLLFTYQTYASKVAPHGGSSPTACDLCSFNVPLAPFNGQDFRNIKVFACLSWILTYNVSFIGLPLKHNQQIIGGNHKKYTLKKYIWFCYISMWHSVWYRQYIMQTII